MAEPDPNREIDDEHTRATKARSQVAPAEARALGTLAILAIASILCVVVPVGIGVLLGTLLAFTTYDAAYMPLVRRTGKPALAAFAITAVTSLAVGAAIAAVVYLLILQGVTVAMRLPDLFSPGGRGAELVDHWRAPLGALKLDPASAVERLRGALGGVAAKLAGWAADLVGLALDGLIDLFFTAFTMYFTLRHWAALSQRAERLMPLNPGHTRRLMREVLRLGRTVVIGNFGTAVVQGALAGIGYGLARLHQPVFWGAMTAVASLIPVLGTLLVWVPAGLFLLVSGHIAAGAFELVWGAVAVTGLCDYFVRPKLVGGGETTSTWLTFVSLFGGIKLFGVIGLFLGPLLAGIAMAVLRVYERARRFRLGFD